jgi:hypothetical protein
MREKGCTSRFLVLHKQLFIYKELYNDTKINRIGWAVIEIPKFNPVGNLTPHEGEALLVEISVLHKPFFHFQRSFTMTPRTIESAGWFPRYLNLTPWGTKPTKREKGCSWIFLVLHKPFFIYKEL